MGKKDLKMDKKEKKWYLLVAHFYPIQNSPLKFTIRILI